MATVDDDLSDSSIHSFDLPTWRLHPTFLALSPYKPGSVLTLSTPGPDPQTFPATIERLFQPFTLSCCMLVSVPASVAQTMRARVQATPPRRYRWAAARRDVKPWWGVDVADLAVDDDEQPLAQAEQSQEPSDPGGNRTSAQSTEGVDDLVQLVLKLYDHRFAVQLRDDAKCGPWTALLDEKWRAFASSAGCAAKLRRWAVREDVMPWRDWSSDEESGDDADTGTDGSVEIGVEGDRQVSRDGVDGDLGGSGGQTRNNENLMSVPAVAATDPGPDHRKVGHARITSLHLRREVARLKLLLEKWRNEVAAYKQMQSLHGTEIPAFYGQVKMTIQDPTSSSVEPTDEMPGYRPWDQVDGWEFDCSPRITDLCEVKGILLEHVPGPDLRQICRERVQVPRKHWQDIVQSAIDCVHAVSDCGILRDETRLPNFVISPIDPLDWDAGYRTVTFDFSRSRGRRGWESAEDWYEAKAGEDEEGAIAIVARMVMRRVGFDLQYDETKRFDRLRRRRDDEIVEGEGVGLD